MAPGSRPQPSRAAALRVTDRLIAVRSHCRIADRTAALLIALLFCQASAGRRRSHDQACLPPKTSAVAAHAVVQFESIVLQDQRIRGATDDYLLSVVHFTIQHPNGRWCPGCLASVRHRFRGANGGALEISMSAADECARYTHALEPLLQDYYRDRVGSEGSAIRVGARGASPWLVGVQRLSRATASIPIANRIGPGPSASGPR
jgi:hypothetical protein